MPIPLVLSQLVDKFVCCSRMLCEAHPELQIRGICNPVKLINACILLEIFVLIEQTSLYFDIPIIKQTKI